MSDDIEERPGGLAGAFLDMEDERQQAIAEGRDTGDDVMPGMGEGAMTLRQALARGGGVTFATLAAIVAVDNLEAATMGTLSPDIRDSLGLSDGAIIFIVSASSAFLILGALPMGWLADRYRRGRIIGFTNLFFGIMTALTGLATTGVALFFARLGVGSTKSNTFTVQATLLADTYPITSRGRVGSTLSIFGSATGTLSPLLVGGLATWIGGPSAWRWVFVILAIPISIVSIFGVPPSRAAARPVREEGRARRSDRGGRSTADLGGACVCPTAADPHDEGGDHRASRRSVSACSPCRSSATCSWRTSTGWVRSDAAPSAR